MKKLLSILIIMVLMISVVPIAYADDVLVEVITTTGGKATIDGKDKIYLSNSGNTAQVSIVAEPDNGYYFKGWEIIVNYTTTPSKFDSIEDSTRKETTFLKGTGTDGVTLKASFEVKPSLTITVDPDKGTLTTPDTVPTSLEPKSTLAIVVTPKAGYEVTGWTVTGDGSSVNAQSAITTLTMGSANTTLEAVFTEVGTNTLTTVASPSTAGSTTPTTAVLTKNTGTAQITATPNNMSAFTGWTVTSGTGTLTDSTQPTTTFTMGDADTDVTANFVTAGISSEDESKGKVSISQKALNSKEFTISATPNTGYEFDKWELPTGTDAQITGSSGTNDTLTLLTKSAVAKAYFKEKPTHTLSLTAGTGGSVVAPTSVSMKEGTSVTIAATPTSGYAFSKWTVTGNGSSVASATSATTTFTMGTADSVATAEFVKTTATYTVTAGKYYGGSYGKAEISYDGGYTWYEISSAYTNTFTSGTRLVFRMTPYSTSYYAHPYVQKANGSYYAPTMWQKMFEVYVTENLVIKLNFTTSPPTGDTSAWQYVVAALASTGVGTGAVITLKKKRK